MMALFCSQVCFFKYINLFLICFEIIVDNMKDNSLQMNSFKSKPQFVST